jgi:hypothetical protein
MDIDFRIKSRYCRPCLLEEIVQEFAAYPVVLKKAQRPGARVRIAAETTHQDADRKFCFASAYHIQFLPVSYWHFYRQASQRP